MLPISFAREAIDGPITVAPGNRQPEMLKHMQNVGPVHDARLLPEADAQLSAATMIQLPLHYPNLPLSARDGIPQSSTTVSSSIQTLSHLNPTPP